MGKEDEEEQQAKKQENTLHWVVNPALQFITPERFLSPLRFREALQIALYEPAETAATFTTQLTLSYSLMRVFLS